DVDLPAAGAAHVGGVAAGFDLKFFDGVGRWAEILRIESRVGVGGAVEQKEICVGACAADDDSRTLAGAPVERIGLAGLCAETYVRAGHGEDQVDQHAAV